MAETCRIMCACEKSTKFAFFLFQKHSIEPLHFCSLHSAVHFQNVNWFIRQHLRLRQIRFILVFSQMQTSCKCKCDIWRAGPFILSQETRQTGGIVAYQTFSTSSSYQMNINKIHKQYLEELKNIMKIHLDIFFFKSKTLVGKNSNLRPIQASISYLFYSQQ